MVVKEMNNPKPENIELTLPINSAYVSAIRLTASSIANRMNFNIDETEDVKAAVSEACTFIIKKSNPAVNKEFKVSFILIDKTLEINIVSENMNMPDNLEDEMGLMMIKALSDSFEILSKEKNLFIKIVKTHKEGNVLI